jgi:hypothetical protein
VHTAFSGAGNILTLSVVCSIAHIFSDFIHRLVLSFRLMRAFLMVALVEIILEVCHRAKDRLIFNTGESILSFSHCL